MTITQDFDTAYQRAMVAWPGPRLVPTALTAAVVQVSGADGAGLSVFGPGGDPVPIGASCAASELAERLQFTAGQGPCHDAHRTGAAVVASEAVMALSWAAYHDLLVTQTPFRSVVALPLLGPLASMATVDLLFHHPDAAVQARLPLLRGLCRLVAAALIETDLMHPRAEDGSTDPLEVNDGGPVWLASPGSIARGQVMVAAGMLADRLGVTPADAVKILKAHAYAGSGTTDDVAAAVVTGRLAIDAFDLDR